MKKYLLIAAAVLGMVACTQKENNEPETPATSGKKVVLHATVANPDDAADGPRRVAPTNIDQIGTGANITYTWEPGDVVYLVESDFSTYHPFTVIASSISGNTADFEGEEFEGLSTGAYMPVYSGDIAISAVLTGADATIAYAGPTFKPVAFGGGPQSATAFTLDQFTMMLHFKLKGAVTLGKMEYWSGLEGEGTYEKHRTITFGDGLTLTSTAQDVYFPIQTTSQHGFTLRFYDTAGNLIMKKTTTVNLTNSSYSGKILNFPELTVAAAAADPAFSVSATTKVTFAPGNLQYQASTNTWRFAEHQYDAIGAANINISPSYTGWIDLFGWGTGSAPTKSVEDDNQYMIYTDWGLNAIKNGSHTDAAGTWRTLTGDEWVYLFCTRTNAAKLCGLGQVNDVNGLFILPDSWTTPAGLTFKSVEGFDYEDGDKMYFEGEDYHFDDNIYTIAQWTQMETAGAVFLPVTGGRRYDDGVMEINDYEDSGLYSSSTTKSADAAYHISFTFDGILAHDNTRLSSGKAVRLVR